MSTQMEWFTKKTYLRNKNDYIRHGSRWKNIYANLSRYKEDAKKYDNIRLQVRVTLTPLNIYHYDETVKFFKDINVEAIGLWCDDEPWNDVRYLPFSIKEKIINKWRLSKDMEWHKQIDNFAKWIMTEPQNYESNTDSFITFNRKMDNSRKQNFESVFPEYAKLFVN